MGCNVVKASKLNKTASYKNEKIIKPSNFVKINPKHFRDVYILGKILGQGAYGTVYFCTHIISGIQRAVKIYDKADLNLANQALLLQEIDILKPLDHPNIISVYEFFEDDLEFSIVLEHCGGGELFQEIVNHRAFTEYEIALIMKQLLSAVYYLHSHNIVHRDIKPENIVFDDSSENLSVKLIDFGSATKINSNEKLKISVGTVYYAAPEIFDQDYDEKCDVWSLGVILYILLIGAFPFRGNNNKQTIEKIREGKFDMCSSKWQFISDDGKDLLIKMLTIDSFRLTAEQAFNHNFIQNNTFFITPKSEALKSAIDNLCSYQYQNKLIEAIGTYISAQLMTNRQKHDLSEVFKSLDKNGDGKLSKNELVLCFNNAKNNREFNTTQVLANVDTDHNGFVDYNEFLKSAFEMNELISRKNLKAAFGMFDINGDGVILAAELKEVLEGESADDKNWNQLLDQVDLNKDGVIDFEEFESLILNHLTRNN